MRRTTVFLITLLALAGCGSSAKSVFTPTTEVVPAVTTTTTDRVAAARECRITHDAANAASAAFYANSRTYPTTFTEMTAGESPTLEAQDGVAVAAKTLTGSGWTLTITGGGKQQAIFTCS